MILITSQTIFWIYQISRVVQETRGDAAAAKLRAMIHLTATVLRDGVPQEIQLRNLVAGDVVQVSTGDAVVL
jgi:P-type Mg2+ transporter